MSPLGWLPALAVGEERLDREHRALMRDINELTDLLFESPSWSSVVAKCEKLREDTIEHFKTEEEVLERTAYPQFARHRSIHRHLRQQLDELIGHIVRVPRASRTEIEAAIHLRSMLIDHFFRKDIAYKSHVLRSRGMCREQCNEHRP
jgi:hemerythrin-like metal-binding protein